MKKTRKKGVALWSILSVVFVILLIASIIGTNIALSASQAINIFLKTDTYKIVENGDGTEDTEYFKSAYGSREEIEKAGQAVAEQVHAEGSVLLKNENNALPLAKDAKVTTLAHSSVDVVTCGTGSADIDTSTAPTLREALEGRGLTVNPTVWEFYTTGAGSAGAGYFRIPGKVANASSAGSSTRHDFSVNEVPISAYTDTEKKAFRNMAMRQSLQFPACQENVKTLRLTDL